MPKPEYVISPCSYLNRTRLIVILNQTTSCSSLKRVFGCEVMLTRADYITIIMTDQDLHMGLLTS